jgi:hypothetical protein
MATHHLDERRGTAAIGVAAFRLADGWRFRLEVDQPVADGIVHFEAVGVDGCPSEEAALGRGLAYAHWLVDRDGSAAPAAVRDTLTELRRHPRRAAARR